VKELNGRVLNRRIDLRLDRPDPLSHALPHELTHVVLADIMAKQRFPRWADEGMAMLADSVEKQQGHLKDLTRAVSNRTTFRLVELLALADYPEPNRQREFYAQSLSLVRYLVERESPERFRQFAQDCAANGYEKALQKHYAISNVAELERMWLMDVLGQRPAVTLVSNVKPAVPLTSGAPAPVFLP
jgi:Peptidase MA superfamily